jgi:hypothetical protein
MLFSIYLLWRYARQVLTNRRETATQIELQLSWGVFLTLILAYFARVAVGHLWYNSGTKFAGSVSTSTLRDYPSARKIRTFKSPTLGLMTTAPFRGELYTYRSPAWVELLGFLVGLQTRSTKREAYVQHEWERLQESVLNRHRRSHCTPASLHPVFIQLNQVLFHANHAICIAL